ncbi:MAG: YwiC-like family protein [Holophagaceae bacterium]
MTRILPPWRTLLPAEHGSWFMLGLPMFLGLLLRPTGAGLCLALAALALFLARPPLRRVFTGQRDGAQVRALLLFTVLAAAGGAAALGLAGPHFLLPLAAVAPLVGLALWADTRRAVRALAVELAAQGAFAGLAAALVAAGGAPQTEALRVWVLATLVGGANLAHVRRFLGYAHGLPEAELRRRGLPVHVIHLLLAGASTVLLLPQGLAGLLWTAWTGLLYLRAVQPWKPLPARTLGWREGGLSVGSLLLLWRALAS